MLKLSYLVEPTNFDKSVLDGPVKLTTRDPDLVEVRDPILYGKAKNKIRTNTTLQSLAIAIYIEELDKEGITLDPREIKRDLQKLKEWEAINLKEKHPQLLWHRAGEYPPAALPPIPIYSDGWKKLWRRGDKKPK